MQNVVLLSAMSRLGDFLPLSHLTIVGAYVVRTSSLNDKHSCQLLRHAKAALARSRNQ